MPVALLACRSVDEHELAGAGVGAVDRDAQQVDRGPPKTHHGREQVASRGVVVLPQEVSEENQRKGHLGERSAEDHHRVAEELDAEGHEEHVPEFVYGEVDVAEERDVAVLVAECAPREHSEHHRKRETPVPLQCARGFSGVDRGRRRAHLDFVRAGGKHRMKTPPATQAQRRAITTFSVPPLPPIRLVIVEARQDVYAIAHAHYT